MNTNEHEPGQKIPLTQDKFAIVDDEDFEWVNCHNWCLEKGKGKEYAQRKIGRVKTVKMHREIMCVLSGLEVDHINGNGLDNRKVNLRLCTHGENAMNRGPNKNSRSPYKGVHFFRINGSPLSHIKNTGFIWVDLELKKKRLKLIRKRPKNFMERLISN